MNQAQQRLECQSRRWTGAVIVASVAAVVRGAVIAAALLGVGPLDHLGEDPDSYREIAQTLAESGTFGITAEAGPVDPTAFRPPLYPWLLSWGVADGQLGNAAVGLLHWVVGVLTCLGVYATLRRIQATPCRSETGTAAEKDSRPGERLAIAAGCLTAIDPLLLMQSTLVMTETLAAGLAVAAWWAATKDWAAREESQVRNYPPPGRAGLSGPGRTTTTIGTQHAEPQKPLPARPSRPSQGEDDAADFRRSSRAWGWPLVVGVFLAAGYLCRPVFAVWIVLWVGWLGVSCLGKAHRRWAARQAIAILAVFAVTAAGWMARNYQTIGKAVWATTHGGYTLLLGNNPYFYDYLDSRSFVEAAFWGEAWDAEPFHREWAARLEQLSAASGGEDSELAADRLASEWAKQEIRRQPAMFLYASLVRVGRLWSPVPRVGGRVGLASWATGAFYGVLGIGVIAGLWRLRRQLFDPAWAPPLLLIVAVTVVHAVYWSNLRMRAPVIPMVAAIAVVGFSKTPLHIRNSRRC
ncbi:hypothetical protein [Candidatus Laterigemmans baculatus]|uniref:hypothetical protein n=1 Tax=Candidatus Laterigemmans baculatus TaxID=2770505 RepID=UPI0013DB14A8|nr:hypothetical protein [Candidatus Laterigemmans baculatus]